MTAKQPQTIFLKDYQPSSYHAREIDLAFDLHESATRVTSKMQVERRAGVAAAAPLRLAGEKMSLLSVKVDGKALGKDDFCTDEHALTLNTLPATSGFVLEIEVEINPQENSALLGLYRSNNVFVTQCEPEGFRRITYSFDRPDVMTIFRTRIEADKKEYPVLLSNGNCTASGDLEGGRHFAHWHDPHPKPTYLFALVAGDLGVLEDTFTTRSGRAVALKIFVEHGKQERCHFAMESLKKSMVWDEQTFGLEYDLDIFMIVAISAFNGGAMENKGLNIFNDKYILADPQTATDLDFERIESVVAHEYFHNWTGNRITCRDWFQLCLKEGLTVFRDQLFSADMRSGAVTRIKDVQVLRQSQFAEDAGPLAHPVRPDSFIEIDNFFTRTVYEKGAELCRMAQTILGKEGFVKGMALYCSRHDGEAATVEQFVAAMGDANDEDLSSLLSWYSQSGTPQITAAAHYDANARILELTLEQKTGPTPDQPQKAALSIPVSLGLVGRSGAPVPLRLEGEDVTGETTRTIMLEGDKTALRFVDVAEDAVPSLFRGLSAPIKRVDAIAPQGALLLMAHDTDPFNRWEAARGYTLAVLTKAAKAVAAGNQPQVPEALTKALGQILKDETLEPAFRALVLTLPTENEIALEMDVVLPGPIHEARKALQRHIGATLAKDFEALYQSLATNEPFSPDAAPAGRRALRNQALSWLSASGLPAFENLAQTHYQMSDNMTDTMAALQVLTHSETSAARPCLDGFYEKWSSEPTVIDKWLQVQATSSAPGLLARVKSLTAHEAFSRKSPNRVRSLLMAFALQNPLHFHGTSGEAYEFIADEVLKLEKINPATAASLCGAFSNWARFEPEPSKNMKAQVRRIADTPDLSANLYEIASKILGNVS